MMSLQNYLHDNLYPTYGWKVYTQDENAFSPFVPFSCISLFQGLGQYHYDLKSSSTLQGRGSFFPSLSPQHFIENFAPILLSFPEKSSFNGGQKHVSQLL